MPPKGNNRILDLRIIFLLGAMWRLENLVKTSKFSTANQRKPKEKSGGPLLGSSKLDRLYRHNHKSNRQFLSIMSNKMTTSYHNKKHLHRRSSKDPDGTRRRVGTTSGWGGPSKTKIAMDKFRARKERKFQETAKTLRAYKKACKETGYDPGQGASRKRTVEQREERASERNNDHPSSDDIETQPWTDEQEQQQEQDKDTDNDETLTTDQTRKRRKKTTIFHKSIQKAAQRKEAQAQAAQAKIHNQQERHAKLAQRKEKARKLRQRTARGQPIMKHYVHDILDKLQKRQDE